MKPDEKKRIDDMKLQTQILDYLRKHESTALWMHACESNYVMDVPMMVVGAVMDLVRENDFAIQNCLQDKFDEGYTQRMKDEGK